jgi:hypothetical protein
MANDAAMEMHRHHVESKSVGFIDALATTLMRSQVST